VNIAEFVDNKGNGGTSLQPEYLSFEEIKEEVIDLHASFSPINLDQPLASLTSYT
jgi:hypothetical protein